jgi:energy-coupling factor transporter transmembrane protein EcfT
MHKSTPVFLKYILLSLLIFGIAIPAFPFFFQEEDSVLIKSRTFKAEELVRGERLFFGLAYQENKSVNCASCHNTRYSDSLNWNPDALEISRKYFDKRAVDLSKVLLAPAGKKMTLVHKDFKLSPEDIVLIKAYMDELTTIGIKPDKPVITNLIFFIFASILFLFSLSDLIVIKKMKKQWIHFVILPITLTYITYSLVVNALAIGHSPDYAPDQPVKFSHAVHAGQNGTDCIYCHSYAQNSKSAGFPSESVCMNCHLIVRNGTRSGAFEIAKVISDFDNMKPIEWIKVHNLQDHVFFSHAQHVGAAGISCQECHGAVEKMDRIKLGSDMNMGWCIDCHRTKNVDFQNNKFYSEYEGFAEKMRNGGIKNITVESVGGTECMKCHY